jgi:hypothetical protein
MPTPRFWEKKELLWVLYALLAVAVSLQKASHPRSAEGYTSYENYRIFRNSFGHLWQGLNPYAAFPAEQWDLFKYSPAFAVGMAPFAPLPDVLGLSLWNLLNALTLLGALMALPILTERQRALSAWLVLPELVLSMQNSQSNGLTAGLMLWAFVAFERRQPLRAAGFVAAGGFLKIFGIFAAALALLYPAKGRFAAGLFVWSLFFALLPLLIVSPSHLAQVYVWWWELLRDDHTASVGLSVQGWLQAWFGWQPPKMAVTVSGLALLAASILAAMRARERAEVRALAWASVLLWVVVFNHKAESPTFIIAMCGVALWYCFSAKNNGEKVLLGITLALVSLSPTDVFPRALREQIVQPYVLKAVPCIVVWAVVTWRLLQFLPWERRGFGR